MKTIDRKHVRDKPQIAIHEIKKDQDTLLVNKTSINTPWVHAQLKHKEHWALYSCLFENWPSGVILRNIELDERKITLRGKVQDIALLNAIGVRCSCSRKIMQQIQSKKNYTEFLCDIYF